MPRGSDDDHTVEDVLARRVEERRKGRPFTSARSTWLSQPLSNAPRAPTFLVA